MDGIARPRLLVVLAVALLTACGTAGTGDGTPATTVPAPTSSVGRTALPADPSSGTEGTSAAGTNASGTRATETSATGTFTTGASPRAPVSPAQPSGPTSSAAPGQPTDPAPPAGRPTSGSTPPAPTFGERVVQLAPGVSDEASGVAPATRTPGAYFLVDDASGTGDIVAVDTAGARLATVTVGGMSAGNAEALSSGPCGATPLPGGPASRCLYVGDIGDNNSRRDGIAVFRIAEPDISSGNVSVPGDGWRYTYPDGPHNAESMMIDNDGSVLIVTKPGRVGSPPHRMYRGRPGGGELVLVREFRPPDAQRPFRTMITGNVATDLAAAPGRVLLLTYDEVQQYTAPTPDAPLSTFPDWPHRRLPLDGLPQAEGVAPAADGCGYVVASEGGPGGTHGSLAVVTCR